MATRNMWTISKTLMNAIKYKHQKYFTVSVKQFVGVEREYRNLYTLSEAVYNPDTGRFVNKDIYSTASMIRIVLYLRDILDYLDGKPMNMDQEIWVGIRRGLMADGKYWPWDNSNK